MDGNSIELLPSNTRKKIALELDRHDTPNWKTLIKKMPKGLYNEKAILTFYMAILQPNGSPTLQLLADLSRKRKTIEELKTWLNSLERFPHLVDLLRTVEPLPPLIITQPRSQTIVMGSNVSFQFEVEGSPPLKFYWFKGSLHLNTQTERVLHLRNVNAEDTGYFICRVSNPYGYIFTDWSKLDVTYTPYTSSTSTDESFQKPFFTAHPHSAYHKAGETLTLSVDVDGTPFPTLQWYHNHERLDGECGQALVVSNISRSLHRGVYYVIATNEFGETTSMSADVIVDDVIDTSSTYGIQSSGGSLDTIMKESLCIRLSNPRGQSANSYSQSISLITPPSPTQKIALIIGNQNYVHANKLGVLHRPLHDAYDIASILMSMDFKVVSLANLTLSAMDGALTYFYNLLDAGTYALFYFAGHGFENDNESYLMPIDATDYVISECFPLSALLIAMTKRAKLSVLLVDTCRINTNVCLDNPISKLWKTAYQKSVIEHKNVIMGYSCCSNNRAMESAAMRNGFFAKFLLEYISQDIKIDDVLFEVSKAMHEARVVDPDTGKPQVVHRLSTVVEDLKLTDTCVPNLTVNEQSILWEQANIAPDSPVTILENEFILVKLVFTAEFSNSLRIQSKIIKKNTTFCDASFILPNYIGTSPVEIVPSDTEKSGDAKYARISNLERLEGAIDIHLRVTYYANGVLQDQMTFYCLQEKPLYAKIATKIPVMN